MKHTTSATRPMRRTWLVQRLHKPIRAGLLAGIDNPFSFGGGLRNGGLSTDAMALLRDVWSFDYMGAAEFELGAVPKALQGMAEDAKRLVTAAIDIDLSTVAVGWRAQEKGIAPGEGTATVYLLCRRAQLDEVEARVRHLATKDYDLKEATHLPSTLRPTSQYDGETVGWLELDNGFAFFTDREMWAQAAALFGVKVPAEVKA